MKVSILNLKRKLLIDEISSLHRVAIAMKTSGSKSGTVEGFSKI